jgi:hypothetical protein
LKQADLDIGDQQLATHRIDEQVQYAAVDITDRACEA